MIVRRESHLGEWSTGATFSASVDMTAEVPHSHQEWDWNRWGFSQYGEADRCAYKLARTTAAGAKAAVTSGTLEGAGYQTITHTLDHAGAHRLWLEWHWDDEHPGYWEEERSFSVIGAAGGVGNVISMFSYERPEATHLVWETRNGDIVTGRNPH